jgi:L-aspartate oxidase
VTAGAGPIRDAASGTAALERLRAMAKEADESGGREGFEIAAMVRAGELLVRSALARTETRGVHVRSDFAETDLVLDGVHLMTTGAGST